MALNHFYIQSGASDLNAGSTTGAAASLTYAGGTFVRATGVFTPASGNPSSDGVAVNDWVSIYTTAGAVAATFVGHCTARDATTITVSITDKLGLTTAVSEGAGAATAKVGGAWASELVLGATGLGTFTAASSLKINIKAATYTITAARTVSMAGATTAPIWFSGYNTTPGDLDADTTNALAKPVLAMDATMLLTFSGNYQILTGLSVTGNRSGACFSVTGVGTQMSRCRSENTSSNAAALALNATVLVVSYSWFKCPTTATTTGVISSGGGVWNGCVAEGGGLAGWNVGASTTTFVTCIGLNNTGSCILATTALLRVFGLTAKSPTADGVKWSGTPTAVSCVVGSLFVSCVGVGINNASGANTANVVRACNDFYNCGTTETGFGDVPAFFGYTEGSDPVTSSTDMTPVVGSNARGNGFPGKYENQSYSHYLDIGAVDHVDPSGGSGGGSVFGGVIRG